MYCVLGPTIAWSRPTSRSTAAPTPTSGCATPIPTTATTSHDDAGNLIDDGKYSYTYDAWHRLVKVQSSEDSRAVTIQTAEFDAKGRRIQKVVTNSGDHDATTVYLYNGQQIIETRDGSSNVVAQFIHGTQYIDELVMTRVPGKDDVYYHQEANWNVIALTDLGGSVLERYDYTAYGEMTVHQETSFGDRDGDQDVDSTDRGTVGVDYTGTVTGSGRILDFDGDGDATDATAFDALTQGLARHPGRTLTGVDQPFGHQGLLYDAEIASHQNRARQYAPVTRRFLQKDPCGTTTTGMMREMLAPLLQYMDGFNLYLCVAPAPTTNVDPSGLKQACSKCSAWNGYCVQEVWCGACVGGTQYCFVISYCDGPCSLGEPGESYTQGCSGLGGNQVWVHYWGHVTCWCPVSYTPCCLSSNSPS